MDVADGITMCLSAFFSKIDPGEMRLNYIEGMRVLKRMEKFESPILRGGAIRPTTG